MSETKQYKQGEKVYVLKKNEYPITGKYVKCQHVVSVAGILEYLDSNEVAKIEAINIPTQPTPATPTDIDIRCWNCGSSNLEQTNQCLIENFVGEYDLCCLNCKITLGYYAYGAYQTFKPKPSHIADNAPTQPTPATPTEQHEYKPGECIEVLIVDAWNEAHYLSYNKESNTHIIAIGDAVQSGFEWEEIRPIQEYPTEVSATPIAQPTDAMSLERFVQEAAMRIYTTQEPKNTFYAVHFAIELYNEIQNQLSK